MSDFIQPFDLVRAGAEKNPTRLAILSPTTKISYGQLASLGARLGQMMRRRGVVPGDIIGVGLKSVWRCVASVAIGHEAAVSVPLSKALLEDNYIGMTWVIVDHQIEGFPVDQQIIINREMMSRLSSVRVTAAPRAYQSPDDLYRIAMSSGTTGRPKAIPVSVSQNHDRAIESIGRWSGSGRFMSFMMPRNGVGWHAWHTSLARGETYLVPTDALTNVRLMEAVGVESVMGSPSQLAVFAQALEVTQIKLPTLRHIQSGGSRLSKGLMDEIRRLTGLEIGNTYSSTELGGVAHRLGEHEDPSYMGELRPDAEVHIVDAETNEPVAEGEYGVIRVRRENMIHGYLFNDEATAQHFKDGWFYPGDIGKLVGNSLYLGARDSELINAGGNKVDPTMVDEVVVEQPEIADAATFAMKDRLGMDQIAIAYVLKKGAVEGDLWANVKAKLKDKMPTRFFPVEFVPRNDWGKPLRRELSERFSEESAD